MRKSEIREIIKEEILKEKINKDESYMNMKRIFEKNILIDKYMNTLKDQLGDVQQWMEDSWIENVMDHKGEYSLEDKSHEFEGRLGNWIVDIMDDTKDFLDKKIKATYKKVF